MQLDSQYKQSKCFDVTCQKFCHTIECTVKPSAQESRLKTCTIVLHMAKCDRCYERRQQIVFPQVIWQAQRPFIQRDGAIRERRNADVDVMHQMQFANRLFSEKQVCMGWPSSFTSVRELQTQSLKGKLRRKAKPSSQYFLQRVCDPPKTTLLLLA